MRVPDWFGSRRIGRRVGVLLLSLTVVTAVLVFGRTPLANAARSAFGFGAAPMAPPAPPPPVISTFSPTSGPVTTIVTISGSGFSGATQVRFGSLASPAIEFVDDSTLLATVPVGLGSPGAPITIDTPLGTATSGSIFGVVSGSAWINPSGGNFFTASNWSNNQVPTSTSDILITLPGFYTVTGPTGGSFRSLVLGAIGGSSNNQSLDINSSVTFTGNIDVKHGGQFNLNGGTLSANGLNVASTFNWNGGNISVTTGANVFPNATFNINGLGTKNLGGRLTNQGILNWLGATTINATTGTQIINAPTGTTSIQNAATLTGPGALLNQGNFQKISGTGTSNFASWSLQNTGTFFIPSDGDVSLASVTFSAPGTLQTELGAVNSTKITTGNASITGGTLQIDNNFNRQVGDTFNIISSASGSGNFTTFRGLDAGGGRAFQPTPNFPSGYRVVVVNAPPPTISGFSPATGTAGSTVTVTGSNFFSILDVTVNQIPGSFTVDSDTQLRLTIPPAATSGPIRVTTVTGNAVSSDTFTVLPLVTGFSPGEGRPTRQVTILGSGFTGAADVRFNGTPADGFTVNSANKITAVVPFGATTGPIRVVVGANSADSATNFTVLPASGGGAPTITNIAPGCATVGAGLVITGTNFLEVTQVNFNSRPAEFTVVDSTRIDVVYPGTEFSTVTVSVVSPDGTANSSAFFNGSDGTFSYLGPFTANVSAVQARPGTEFAVAFQENRGTFVGSVNSLNPWAFSENFGQVLTFAYDPVQTNTIYAGVGVISSGAPVLYRSTDNGLSWTPATSGLPSSILATGSIVAFPGSVSGSTTVLIGTNVGVFRSDDRGATWTDFNTGLPPQPIDSLAYSPASGGFLYAGLTGGQIHARAVGGPSWNLSSNGLPGSLSTNFFVVADPGNGQVAYAAVNDFQGAAFTVYKTTDRGANWSPSGIGLPPQPQINLAITPVGNALFVESDGTLFKSTDGAASWQPVGLNLPVPPVTPVTFIRTDGSQALVGTPAGVYVSKDGGNFWSPLNRGFSGPGARQIAGVGNARVYIQDERGSLYRSTRDGASPEFVVAPFDDSAFLRPAPSNRDIVYAGGFFTESSGLVKSTDGGSTWFPISGGGLLLRDLAVNPTNPDTLFLLRSGGLFRSTDGGNSFAPFGTGLPTNTQLIRYVQASPNILYAAGNGTTGAFRSTDGGNNWSPINTGLPLGPSFGITSIVPSPSDVSGNTCFLGTSDARIFRTTDGGANWTQVSSLSTSGFIASDTTDFAFFGSDIFVSYFFQPSSSFTPPEGYIQRSVDGGMTWTEFSPGSSIGGIYDLDLPTNGLLYAATSQGTFAYDTVNTCTAGPIVTNFTPANGLPGSSVTIIGTGFTGAFEVSIAGFTSPGFTVDSDTQITAEVPSAAGSSGPICVATNLGTGCSAGNFSIDVPGPPSITSNSPGFGPAGTVVTITGSNFFEISAVEFKADEGTAPASFTVISPTQLTAVVPNNPLISGPIRITGTFGTASGGGFTIQNAPTVGAFTPTSGAAGTTVTVNGTDFIGVTAVQFNGVNASSFNVLGNNQLTAVVPPGATTGPISVTTSQGTGTSSTNFTVNITYNWINPSGGDFGTASNWSSGFVPGPSNVAIIDLPGTYTVTSGSRDLGGLTLGGVSGTQTLLFNGNLALNGPAIVNPNGFFNFGDGTLAGGGTVTVAGQMSFIGGGAAYSAGTLTIQSGAAVTKNTSGNLAFNSPVNNSGTFITPDSLNVNAIFTNLNGAIFEVRGDGGFAGGGPFHINAGATFRKTLGTGNFTPSGILFNNDGLMECQSGTIDLQGGGEGAGEFRSSAGAAIIFRADYTFNNGALLTGAGTSFLPGNVTLDGNVTMRNASIGGLGNTIGGAGNLIIPNGGTVIVTGGGATFAGTGTIEVQNGGTFNLNGIGHTFNRTVNNAGIINWSQLDITIVPSSAINNLAGGFFRVQHGDRFINGGGSFNNAGTFEQPSGASVTVNVPFTNSGVINVPAVGFMTIANLVQTPTGAINTQLGGTSPGTNHSQLRTTNFTAAGTFNAAYINGFTASPGNVFDVVTFSGSRTGTFAAVNLPPTVPGQVFLNGFKPNSFALALVGTPAIASFTPTSGIVGTSVTLTGSNFTGATSVTFNGTNAPGFTVVNDTTITVNVPTGATTGTISVTNPAGTGTSSGTFTVFQTPTVTSFTPTSGAVGTSVTITGTNFTGTTAVRFNGTLATGFTVVNDTTITVNVPTGATTGSISVTNPAGTGTSSGTFTVFQTPTVTSFTPTSGTFGTSVTITGTNFNGTTAVTFNGTTAPGFTVVNPTTITVNVPTGASTGPIAVTNPAGTGTSAANFNVVLTFNWINPAGGDFNIGANWSSGVVPGPTDFAVIDLPGTYSVTVTNVAVTLGGLTLGGVSGTQTLVISNTFGGGFTLNGIGTVNPNGRITFNAGTLGGTGSLNLTAGSTMTLESAFGKAVAGTLNNAGTIAFVSGSSDLTVNGTLNNLSGGLFDIPTDNTITVGGALNNRAGATLRKSAGTGPSFITTTGAGTFDNFGTLLCQSGQLRPNSVRIQNGSTFTATGGGFLLLNSTSGTTTFAAGSPTFTSNGATIDGDLAGTGSFTGLLKFNAGTITGTLNVTSGSTLTVLNTTFGKAVSGTLNNGGTVNYFAPSFDLNINPGGTFNNLSGGLFDLNTDNGLVINTSAAFNNQAGSTFRKSGGSGTSVVANSGSFTNAGAIVAPLTGFLQINGLFTQTGTGVINTTLNGTTAGTNYSQLQLQSPTLAGTLNVALQVGFTPAAGNTFDVVTFSGPRTGGFASVNLPPPSTGISYSGNFTGISAATFRVVVNSTVPSITSFTPTSGSIGTVVTITGVNFTGTTAVSFNGTSATTFTVVNDTTLTVTVPSGATTGTISVTNANGTGTSAASFTVIPPPAVTSFTPTSGPIGTSVTITGTNFTGATDVVFDGTSATTFTVVNDTTITATVPTGATTGPISVTTAGGTGISATNFTVIVGFDWINPSGGSFTDPSNWSGGIVPGPMDMASFNLPNTYTVTGNGDVAGVSFGAGNVTFSGAVSAGTALVDSSAVFTNDGTFTLNGPGTVNGVFNHRNLLNGTGSLGVNGTLNWTQGNIQISTVTVAGGGAFNITGATSRLCTAAINNGGTLTLDDNTGSNINFSFDGPVTNTGTFNSVNTGLVIGNGSFTNAAGGTVNIGTGSGAILFSIPFNNAGTVTLLPNGGLALFGGGTFSGPFNLGDRQIQLDGSSPYDINTGTTFAGNGTVLVQATVNLNTNVTIPHVVLANPTGLIQGSGNLVISDGLAWNQGSMTGTGQTTLASTAVGSLGSTASKTLGRNFLNQGTLLFTEGNLVITGANGRLTNQGSIQDDFPSGVVTNSATGSFVNEGIYGKTGGNTQFQNFRNSGTLNLSIGTGFAATGFEQTASGILNTRLNGTTPVTGFTQLQTQSATFAGTLNVTLEAGFTPTAGNVFDVVTYTGRAGSFATVNLPPPSTGIAYSGSFTGISAGTFRVVVNSTVPTVASFTPTAGPAGTSVTITGTNFTGATGVAFNGTSATTFTILNDTTITATVPAGATTGPISVTTPSGTAMSGDAFSVLQPPTVTAFTPTSGGIGVPVTITGSGFTGASVVTFHLTPTTAFTVVNDTTITTTVPAGATTGPISVTTAGGTGTSAASFVIIVGFDWINPAGGSFTDPSNWSGGIVPGPMDMAVFNLAATYTVTGNGDVAGLAVTNGNVTFNGTITTPNLSVPGSTATLVNLGSFNLTGPATVDGRFDNNGTITLGNTLTIGGRFDQIGGSISGVGDLVVNGTLNWFNGTIGGGNGDGNFVINSIGQSIFDGPGGKQLRRTLLNDGIILWNDGDIRGDTSAFPPTIFNRSTGRFRVQNDGDSILFVGTFNNQGHFEKPSGSGTNLITWDFRNEGILSVPSTTGILFINNYTQTSAGFLDVTVGGTNAGVNLSQLQTINAVLDGTLNISLAPGFTPTQGQRFQVITFDTGVVRPAGVKRGKVGDTPKTSSGDFAVINGTSLSGGLFFRPVNAFSAYTLKVVGPPVITSFSPSSGLVGTSVLITGLDFDGATSVQFNGTEAPGFTVSSLGNQITATVPAGATTGPITVTTQLGTGTSSTNFIVNVPPTITSFNPTSGPVGTIVTITGSNFTGATSVTFNGTTATGFTVDSDTQITATVPVGASTGPISVTSPNGTGTSSTNYTVTILPPVINSFTPASGPVGTVVMISGNNFDGVTSVQFNGVPAGFTISPLISGTPTEPVTGGYNTGGEPVAKSAGRTTARTVGPLGRVRSTPKASTTITATVPAGATTGFITVTGPGGTATSPSQFQVLFPPTITAFSPMQGPPGTSVVMTGTNFTGATSVNFNGTPATTFTVNSATQITAVVPAGATTGKISVTTPDGNAMSVGNFVVCGYTVAPTSFIVTSAGGDRSVTVATFAALGQLSKIGVKDASLCPWTAVSNSSFITILTGSTGTGNGTVTFRVAPFVGSGTRSGTITVAGQTITITQQPSFVAGDFNGDLKSDLLWRNIATGQSSIWLLDGTTFNQNLPLSSSETCWFVGGVNDFTGDGQVDILWRNQTITGANGVWRFNGPTVVEGLTVTPDQPNLSWVMNCTGDFNGDGKPDIVLRNSQTGAAEIWLMNGVNRTSVVPLTIAGLPATEQFVGAGDFSGDGRVDLLVRNQAAGTLRVITLNGTTPTGTLTIPTLNSNWELSAVGDFNADGRPDLVWRNLTDGSNVIWLMNGTTLIQSLPLLAVPDPDWRIVGPK